MELMGLSSRQPEHPYFLRMGQSFIKWPILPQMRQQRSFGATSPSVRTSGSKKYSCKQMKTNHVFNGIQRFHDNTRKHADADHQAGVDGGHGLDWRAEHSSAVDEGLHDEIGH